MKLMILLATLCLGSLLPGQGTWEQTQFEVSPTYDYNLRNYHHGGWEKLDFHIHDQHFTSWGEIQDIGDLGGGGTIQKDKTAASAIACTFKPDSLPGTPDSSAMIGQGLAQKTNGAMQISLSLTLHDHPAEGVLHGYVETVLKIDGSPEVDKLERKITGATGSSNWGSITFGYGGVGVTIPISTGLGSSSEPRESDTSSVPILQGPEVGAKHVAQSFQSWHGVFLAADSNWLTSARVEETSEGSIWCSVVLKSKWVSE